MSEERRTHDRVSVNREFTSLDAFLNEYVSNISHGGVFIRSKSPLPVGTKVELRFTIILDDIECIEGIGEVVRVVEGEHSGMGVSFTELTDESRDLINRLVERRRHGADTIIAVLEDEIDES